MQVRNFQPTLVNVRREMVIEAVNWVCNRILFTIDRGNMNPRSIAEKLDDGIMGEIASVAVMQFLMDNGRHVLSYDQIRRDSYQEPDPGWDVLSSKQSFDEWLHATDNVKEKPHFAHSFSIKSSRIPKADQDDINTAISRRDFKIFKKSGSIVNDLTADFEVQVYFSLQKSKFDSSFYISLENIQQRETGVIIEKLKLMDRYSECYLSGAVSRKVLIDYSNSLPEKKRYWSSNHAGYNKEMWLAPLTLGTSFQNIASNPN